MQFYSALFSITDTFTDVSTTKNACN